MQNVISEGGSGCTEIVFQVLELSLLNICLHWTSPGSSMVCSKSAILNYLFSITHDSAISCQVSSGFIRVCLNVTDFYLPIIVCILSETDPKSRNCNSYPRVCVPRSQAFSDNLIAFSDKYPFITDRADALRQSGQIFLGMWRKISLPHLLSLGPIMSISLLLLSPTWAKHVETG